jgi:Tfp pilus assembly protein PilV
MTRRQKRPRAAGAALLEALVAATVIAITVVGAVGALEEHWRAQRRQLSRERSLLKADRLLESISLWTANDLDRHLGARRQGQFSVEVQKLSTTIYRVVIFAAGNEAPLLGTTLYRPKVSTG